MKHFRFSYAVLSAMLLCGCTPGSSVTESTDSPTASVDFTEGTSEAQKVSSEAESTESEEVTESETQEDTESKEADSSSDTETEPAETAPSDTVPESTEAFFSCEDILVANTDARLRTAPSLDSSVYDVLKTGTEVQAVAKSESWYIVSYGYGTYYVYAELLTKKEDESTPETDRSETSPSESTAVNTGVTPQITANGTLYSTGSGPLICIDAGHQAHGNSEKEPNAPGSSVMKAKVAAGTSGVASGITEASLNLTVSLKLRDELIGRGYNVLMIRETADVNISNAERALMANAAGADAFIRIHANGSENQSVSGALTMSPSAANPYLAGLYSNCRHLSDCVVSFLCARTGAANKGVYETDTMTGINWCTVPVTIVEMGYMTNPTEDLLMNSPDYQEKIVLGIADGIDVYFGR